MNTAQSKTRDFYYAGAEREQCSVEHELRGHVVLQRGRAAQHQG